MVRAGGLALLLTVLLAAPAAATPRIGPFFKGGPARAIQTDGSRWLAVMTIRTQANILDTQTGRASVAKAPACPGGGRPSIGAMGGGHLVWDCTDYGRPHLVVVQDLRTGAQTLPAAIAGLQTAESGSSDGARFRVTAVGTRWIHMTRVGYHYFDEVLLGIGTPQVIKNPATTADRAVDLDAVSGVATLCRGIRNPYRIPDAGEQLSPTRVDYQRPYALVGSRVQACTGARRPPAGRLGHPQLGGGMLTWSSGRDVLLQATPARRVKRRAPGRILAVQHTRRSVFVLVRKGTGSEVFQARLRGVR